ncbi:hypothetical protein B6259_02505 [Ruminococcaceae bacterium CPB6]|nr:hypothetical protein B6259_02505 [Ruminococcaceae bacterium CPB6]
MIFSIISLSHEKQNTRIDYFVTSCGLAVMTRCSSVSFWKRSTSLEDHVCNFYNRESIPPNLCFLFDKTYSYICHVLSDFRLLLLNLFFELGILELPQEPEE